LAHLCPGRSRSKNHLRWAARLPAAPLGKGPGPLRPARGLPNGAAGTGCFPGKGHSPLLVVPSLLRPSLTSSKTKTPTPNIGAMAFAIPPNFSPGLKRARTLIVAGNGACRISILGQPFRRSLPGGFGGCLCRARFQPIDAHSLGQAQPLLVPVNALVLCICSN